MESPTSRSEGSCSDEPWSGPTMEQLAELDRMMHTFNNHMGIGHATWNCDSIFSGSRWERFLDEKVDPESRWHSSNHGLVETADVIGDQLVCSLRETARAMDNDEDIECWAEKLWRQLEDYEKETRPLIKLAQSGRIIKILLTAVETSRGVLNIRDSALLRSWYQDLQDERKERIDYYAILLAEDSALEAEIDDESKQLEALTLLKYGLEKYESVLNPQEEAFISAIYDQVVAYSGLVTVQTPEWFSTHDNDWLGLDKSELDEGEESCLRQVSVWSGLLHPHVRRLYAACHVGKPFIVHEQGLCVGSFDMDWRQLMQCALGLEYVHGRGLVVELWSEDIIQRRYEKGVVSGLALIRQDKAGQTQPHRLRSCRNRPVGSTWLERAYEVLSRHEGCECGIDEIGMVSQAVDIFYFGFVLFDALREARKCEETHFPDSEPSYLNNFEWELLSGMCSVCPLNRLNIKEVVHKMAGLATMEESLKDYMENAEHIPMVGFEDEDGNAYWIREDRLAEFFSGGAMETTSDVDTYIHPSASQTSSELLSQINDLCSDEGTGGQANRAVYWRLEDLYQQLKQLPDPPKVSVVERFCSIVWTFFQQVESQSSLSLSESSDVCSSRSVIDKSYTIHQKIDQFIMETSQVTPTAAVHDWKPEWGLVHQTSLQAVLDPPEQHAARSVNEADQAEAKVLLQYEATSTGSSENALSVQLMSQTPRWFIPRYLIDFTVTSGIGEGSFASVCKAKLLSSDVVIKQVKTTQLTPQERQQFLHEVDLWFSLNHEHLIKLYGACHVGRPFFVCELASKGTLVDALKNDKELKVWRMLWDAAKGLEHLHERGIIHGDLKGNNILVCYNKGDLFDFPVVKLADFGLSVVADSKPSVEQGALGAYRWKAPECLMGESPSFASDIYSFGMCIIEAVSGTLPWGERLPDLAVKRNVTVKKELPPLPKEFGKEECDLIQRMCCFDPDERINAATVEHLLRRISKRMVVLD